MYQRIKNYYETAFGTATPYVATHAAIMTGVWIVALVLEPWVVLGVSAVSFLFGIGIALASGYISDSAELTGEMFSRLNQGEPTIYKASYWPAYLLSLVVVDLATVYPIAWYYFM